MVFQCCETEEFQAVTHEGDASVKAVDVLGARSVEAHDEIDEEISLGELLEGDAEPSAMNECAVDLRGVSCLTLTPSADVHPLMHCDEELLLNVRLITAEAFMDLPIPWPRCQDVPPHCFGLPGPQDILVAVSHAWPCQLHPDPAGVKHSHICAMLSALNVSAAKIFLFVDFVSVPQRPYRADQEERSTEQLAQFKATLSQMHKVYFYADRIIHLDVDADDAGFINERVKLMLPALSLQGVDITMAGPRVQIIGDNEDPSGSLSPSGCSWKRFDVIAGEGDLQATSVEQVHTWLAADGSQSDLVTLERYSYGLPNTLPADVRGWVFLERFISMVKCAMLDATVAGNVVLSNSSEVAGKITNGADRLRAAALADDSENGLDQMRRELETKQFSNASADKMLSGSSTRCQDREIVESLMVQFVEYVCVHWHEEAASQSRRANALKHLATYTISILIFSAVRFFFAPLPLPISSVFDCAWRTSRVQSRMSYVGVNSDPVSSVQLNQLTFTLSAVVTTFAFIFLAFGALPAHDIRQDPHKQFWYECALSCSVFWQPAVVYEIMIWANGSLFVGSGRRLGWRFFVKACVAGSWIIWLISYSMNTYVAYPTPWLFAAFAILSIFLTTAATIYLDMPSQQRKTSRLRYFVFIIFCVFMQVYFLVMLAASGLTSERVRASQGKSGYEMFVRLASGLIMPFVRKVGMSLLGRIAKFVHANLCVFALFWCVMIHALCVPLALGTSDSALLTATIMCIDLVMELLALWNVVDRDIKFCDRTILSHEDYVILTSTSMAGKMLQRASIMPRTDSTPHMIATYESRWMLTFLAFEQGDILAPCMLMIGWMTIFFSRNREAFAGIGDDVFGWQRPESIDGTDGGRAVTFAINVGIFVGFEGVAALVLGIIMKKVFRVNLRAAQQWLLRSYGWELMIQNALATYSVLCALHVTCGVDISYELKPFFDPWGFFKGDEIPAMYHERGFSEFRP